MSILVAADLPCHARPIRKFSLLIMFTIASLAATPSSAASAPANFRFRISNEPQTLDWTLAHTSVETHLLMNLMEGLLSYGRDMHIIPALASAWKVSADGKVYTFTIRKGAQWSDGVAVKAPDFVYSWRRLLTPATGAPYAYFLADIEGAEAFSLRKLTDFSKVGIRTVDDQHLEIRLRRPIAHFLHLLTFWVTFPLRQDLVEKFGSAWEKPGNQVTTGPFVLESHDFEQKYVLKRNPHYWGKHGNLEQVTALIVPEESTALALYEAGKLDFLGDLSSLDVKRFAQSPELKVFRYAKTGYLGFSTTQYPTTLMPVRKALGMAIDRAKLPQFLQGGETSAHSLVPPGMLAYSPKIGPSFDPEGARIQLARAGLDRSYKGPVEILLQSTEKQVLLGQFIQAEIKRNLGWDVQLAPYDHRSFRAQLDLRRIPMFQQTWGADYPDPDGFLSLFLRTSGNNSTGWGNEYYDAQVLAARGMTQASAREKIYLALQKQLIEDEAVILPLYYDSNRVLVRKKVKGFNLNPLNYLYLKEVSLGD